MPEENQTLKVKKTSSVPWQFSWMTSITVTPPSMDENSGVVDRVVTFSLILSSTNSQTGLNQSVDNVIHLTSTDCHPSTCWNDIILIQTVVHFWMRRKLLTNVVGCKSSPMSDVVVVVVILNGFREAQNFHKFFDPKNRIYFTCHRFFVLDIFERETRDREGPSINFSLRRFRKVPFF